MSTELEERVVALERELEIVRTRLARIEPVSGQVRLHQPRTAPRADPSGLQGSGGQGLRVPSPTSAAASPARSPHQPAPRTRRPRTTPRTTVPSPVAMPPSPAPPRPAEEIPWWKPAFNVEELLGGRLLALAGGIAVLVGAIFFVALAIDRGWMGETARVALALTASTLLLAAGAWLYERRGRTQAALCAVGAAIASLYLSLAAGAALYHLLPAAAALAAALAVGALATALAVRWNAGTIAGLGILGCLLSPLFAGGLDGSGALFLLIAYGAAAAVCIWRGWRWLAISAFTAAGGQIAVWSLASPALVPHLAVLAAFGALSVGAAIGSRGRSSETLHPDGVLLLVTSALLVGGLGLRALPYGDGALAGGLWVAGCAAVYAALGAAALRLRRSDRPVAYALLGVALVGADVALGLLAGGVVLSAAWALSAFALAWAIHRVAEARDLLRLGLGGQLSLAIAHTLLFDAPPGAVAEAGVAPGGALAAVAAVAVSAFGCARLATVERAALRVGLDALALAALGYVTTLALDGLALTAAWAALAVALGRLASGEDALVARAGALAFLGLAIGHALTFEAPPAGVLDGHEHVGTAVAAVVAVGLASWRLARGRATWPAGLRVGLDATAVAAAGYAAAVCLDGAALSLAWAAIALVLGRFADGAEPLVPRLGALTLFGLAAGHTLALEAPAEGLVRGLPDLGTASLTVAAVGLTSWRLARLLGAGDPLLRAGLDGLAVAAAAYIAALTLDGAFLVLAWAGLAAALGQLRAGGEIRTARVGAYALLGLAAVHTLAFEARPDVLLYGADDLGSAALALVAIAAAAFATARGAELLERSSLLAAAGIAALGVASVAIVSGLTPAGVGVAEDAQVALSALWGTSGLALLWAGLRRRRRPLRLAGLGLLVVSLAKVFLFDLQALDSIWRVLSCVALGLVLLLAALAYQRMRPDDAEALEL